ncbi:MAG TPA: glycosyltransferase family 4 protein [Gammaproteobacteria bacterium]|nr:glycosyltransferase family 4 protein [Gammaproteobacteria bacterium]
MKRALLPYRYFGPHHCARIEPSRREFAAAGLELVPVSIFPDSRQYRWSGPMDQSVVRLDLNGDSRDRLSSLDVTRLYSALSRLSPDVVFVNGWSARDALLCHAWCLSNGVARVLISDSQAEDRPRGAFKEWMKSRLVAGCGAFFAAGQSSSRYLRSLGVPASAITLGCDVVDNSHFARARRLRGEPGYRLLTVSRLIPEKNLVASAQAFLEFCRARDSSQSWRWTIVGYGPEQHRLQAIADGSRGRIVLAGFRDYEALVSEYAGHDLYWQPSLSEPWGLVVNEAMASGMPVLVSRQCGCAEDLVRVDTGWRFDASSTQGLIGGLEAAANDRKRWAAMGAAAAAQIGDWDLDRFAQGALGAARIALAKASPGEVAQRARP